MTVMLVTQYSGGALEQVAGAGHGLKPIVVRAGALFYRIGQIFAGDAPGAWVAARGYADWAALGQAQQTLARDAEYQGKMAAIASFTRPVGRAMYQFVFASGTVPSGGGAVSAVTFYKGGSLGDVRAAPDASAFLLGFGASDYSLSRVTAGLRAGQWMVTVRCADWASYGAVQDKAAADPGFNTLLARVAGWADMTERLVVEWTDV